MSIEGAGETGRAQQRKWLVFWFGWLFCPACVCQRRAGGPGAPTLQQASSITQRAAGQLHPAGALHETSATWWAGRGGGGPLALVHLRPLASAGAQHCQAASADLLQPHSLWQVRLPPVACVSCGGYTFNKVRLHGVWSSPGCLACNPQAQPTGPEVQLSHPRPGGGPGKPLRSAPTGPGYVRCKCKHHQLF